MSTPQEESSKAPKFCPSCGNKVSRDKSKYCSTCGHAFSKPVESLQSTNPTADQTLGIPTTVSNEPSRPSFDTFTPYSQSLQNQEPQSSSLSQNEITSVKAKIFNRTEFTSIVIFAAMGFVSHIMRYFLLYNSFPSLLGLIIALPLYFMGVLVIFFFYKYFMRNKGIHPKISVNRFDFTRSLVFSTFFLTLLPSRLIIDKELSTVPETIQIPQSGQYGMTYQNISRSEYVGTKVKPYTYLISSFLLLVLTIILMIYYLSFEDIAIVRSFQLFTSYLGSYVVVELAPIFGRHNKEASSYGKYRTVLVFITGILVTIASLMGELIFAVLSLL